MSAACCNLQENGASNLTMNQLTVWYLSGLSEIISDRVGTDWRMCLLWRLLGSANCQVWGPILLQQAADTIRYDSGYLTCSKKLTGSQLSLPHSRHLRLIRFQLHCWRLEPKAATVPGYNIHPQHQHPSTGMLIDGVHISPVKSVRDLGIYIDADQWSQLSWLEWMKSISYVAASQ